MATIEQLTPGARVRGVVADDVVTVIEAKSRGSTAVNLTYRIESTGRVDGRLLFRANLDADHRGRTVTLTRNEQLVAKNKRQHYVLAVVEIDGETVTGYHTIADPLGRETDEGIAFGTVSTTFDIDELVSAEQG